ncbi:MAG: hypothetical protein ACOCTT_00305 [archaeon]
MKKGQLTIEYLLILTVLIILFTSISMDLMDFSSQGTLQIQTEQLSEIHGSTLRNNAESISLQGTGAKQTITITAPPDCGYNLESNKLTLNCIPDSPSENYTNTEIGDISDLDVRYQGQDIDSGQTGQIGIIKN